MKAPTHLFDQTISTTRSAAAVDAAGSPVLTFTASLSGVRARIQPLSGYENAKAGRDASQTTFAVYISSGQDILVGDRITWGSRTLHITEPPQDFDAQGVLAKITAEEVVP